MSKKQIQYTINLDANLSNLENKMNSLKQTMAGLMVDGKNSALSKQFTQIEKAIDTLRQKTSQPITSQAMFGSMQKDLGAVSSSITKMINGIKEMKNSADGESLSLLPPDLVQQFNQALNAYAKLSNMINQEVKETAELKAAKKELLGIENQLVTQKNKLDTSNQARNSALVNIEAINKQIEASEELIEQYDKEAKAAKKAYEELEKIYEKKETPKNKKIVLDDGTETSLAKARNKSKKANDKLSAEKSNKETLNSSLGESEAQFEKFDAAADKAAKRIKELEQLADICGNKVRTMQAAFEADKAAEAATALEQYKNIAKELGVSIDGLDTVDAQIALQMLSSRFEEMAASIKGKADAALDDIQTEFQQTGTAVKQMSDQVSNGAIEFERLDESAKKAEGVYNKIKEFVGAAGAVRTFSRALRDAFNSVKELDAVMTEMAVVTDLGIGDYWEQLPEYSDRANKLGVSIKSAYESATLFYQQGLNTNEVVALSNETLKMARIAGLDAAEATDRMTAALRGFNMELNETSAQKVADVYAELAAITASDVDEISTAMTKTASIASNAGMEFETTAAFLSQIIETTRESAETAGTAMKTVIARFQELKKDPSEIGEVDGEIVDANKIETALRSVGVALRDSSGQFRDLDEVFLELSKKWDGLDTNTQRYIATIAAGSRQQSRFIAMMSDYGRTQELVASAQNSAGASSRQYEKTLDSLESKLAQLKNAWDTFVTGILNSDLIKGFVDILTKVLTTINNVTKGFEGFGSSFSKISVLFAVFKAGQIIVQKFGDKVKSIFGEFGTAFGEGVAKGIENAANKGMPAAKKLGQDLKQAGEEGAGISETPTDSNDPQQPAKKPGFLSSASNAIVGTINAVKSRFGKKNTPQQQPSEAQQEQQDLNTFAASQGSFGQDMLQSAVQGGAAQLSAAILPWDEIQAQFEQKMAAMGQSTKQIEEAWNRCATSFQQGGTTVQQALDAVNKELDEASAGVTEIEQKSKKKGGAPTKKPLERSDRRITITNKTKKATKTKKDNTVKNEKKKQKAIGKTQKAIEKTGKVKEQTGKKGQQIDQQEEQQQQTLSESYSAVAGVVGNVGAAVTGVGVAFGVAGTAFENMGMPGIGEAFTKVGTAATMVGGAISFLSSIMSLASAVIKIFEESNEDAEKQQKSQIKTSIAQFATNILTALGFTTVAAGETAAQIAGWPLLVVTLAIMAAFVALIATLAIVVLAFMAVASVFKSVAAKSPDAQLEAAEAAAEKAADAADRAAEAYEHLRDSLEGLDGKYKALEELTEGTREWEDAVKEINDEVLDLIKLYPALAKEVKNVNGVLTLDMESENVQAILDEAQAKAASAKGIEYDAQKKVIEKQQDVKRSKLDEKYTIGNQNLNQMGRLYAEGMELYGKITAITTLGGYGIQGMAITEMGKMLNKGIDQMENRQREQTDAMAEALARGVVVQNEDGTLEVKQQEMAEELGITNKLLQKYQKKLEDGSEALLEYGNSVIAAKEQQRAYSQAQANAAVEAALGTKKLTSSMEKMVGNIADAGWADAISQQHEGDYENLKNKDKKAAREEIARNMYGDSAEVNWRGNKITYKNAQTGEATEVEMTKEEWVQFYDASQAESHRTNVASELPEAINAFIVAGQDAGYSRDTLEKLLMDQEGSELTQADINELSSLSRDQLKQMYLTNKEIREGFPTLEEFLDKTDKARNFGQETNDKAFEKLASALSVGGQTTDKETLKQQQGFAKLNAGSVKAFAEDIESLMLATSSDNSQLVLDFADSINEALIGMDNEDANAFVRTLSDLDWKNQDDLDRLGFELEKLGLDIPQDQIEEFVKQLQETGTVMDKIPLDKLKEGTSTLIKAAQELAQNNNQSISKDTFEQIKNFAPELEKDFLKSETTGEYTYIGKEDFNDVINQIVKPSDTDQNELAYKDFIRKNNEKNSELVYKKSGEDITGYWNLEQSDNWSKEERASYLKSIASEDKEAFKNFTGIDASNIDSLDSSKLEEVVSKFKDAISSEGDDKETLKKISEYNKSTFQLADPQTLAKNLAEYSGRTDLNKVQSQEAEDYASVLALQAKELGLRYMDTSSKNPEDWKEISVDSLLGATDVELQAFIDTLNKATLATEAMADIENEYSQINRDISENNLRATKRENANTEFQQKLSSGSPVPKDAIEEYLKNNLSSIGKSRGTSEAIIENAKTARDSIASTYSQYITIDQETGYVEVDYAAAEKDGMSEKVTEAAEALTSYQEIILEEEGVLLDLAEEEKEILDMGKEEYADLITQAQEALINNRQEEIDSLTSISDAIGEAKEALVNKIQEQIQEERQARQNAEKEQDLSDKQARLAALKRDTSGANAAEIAKLEKDLAKDTQSYQDSLVDQEIDKLAKQNEKAAEQRQQQIDTLQNQLDLWVELGGANKEAQAIVNDSLSQVANGVSATNTSLGQLLSKADGANTMSDQEKEIWAENLNNQVSLALVADTIKKDQASDKKEIVDNSTTEHEKTKNTLVTEYKNSKEPENSTDTGVGSNSGDVGGETKTDLPTTNGEDPQKVKEEVKELNAWQTFWQVTLPALAELIWKGIKWLVLEFAYIDEIVHWAIGFLKVSFIPIWHGIRDIGLAIWELIKTWGLAIAKIFTPILEFINGAVAIATDEGTDLKTKIKEIASLLWDKFKAFLLAFWQAWRQWITTDIPNVLQKLVSGVLNLVEGIYGFVLHAIGGLIAAIVEMIAGWVKNIINLIGSFFGKEKIGSKLAQAMTGDERNEHVIQTLWDKAVEIFNKIFDVVGNIYHGIIEFVEILLRFLLTWDFKATGAEFSAWWNSLKGGIQDIFLWLTNWIKELWGILARGIEFLGAKDFEAKCNSFFDKITNFIKNFSLGKMFDSIWDAISGFFVGAWKMIVNFFTNTIPNLFAQLGSWLKTAIPTAWKAVENFFGSIFDWLGKLFTEMIPNLLKQFGSFIGEKAGNIANNAKNFGVNTVNKGKQVVQKVKESEIYQKAEEIYTKLVDTIKKIFDKIKNQFIGIFTDFGGTVIEPIKKAIIDTFKNIGNFFISFLKGYYKIIGKIFTEVFGKGTIIGDFLQKIYGFFGLGDLFSKFQELLGAESPFDALITYFRDAFVNFGPALKNIFIEWWNGATGLIATLKSFFTEKLPEIWNNLVLIFTEWWNGATGLVGGIKMFFTQRLPEIVHNAITAFVSWWTGEDSLANRIAEFFTIKLPEIWNSVWITLQTWWNNIWTTITKWWNDPNTFLGKIQTLWNTVTEWFANVATVIEKWWNDPDSLVGKLQELWTSVETWWNSIVEAVKKFLEDPSFTNFTNIFTTFKDGFLDVVQTIVTKFDELNNDFAQTIKELISSVVSFISGIGKALLENETLKPIIKNVAEVYNSAANTVNNVLNDLSGSRVIGGLIPSARLKTIDVSKFKTGGLADFTGPAWLDGTPSKPEIVLNQQDTQNFLALKDILSEAMSRGSFSSLTNESAATYYDVSINVDSIANDYDVEQMADKIKSMIYNDSMYRNVNTVNPIR